MIFLKSKIVVFKVFLVNIDLLTLYSPIFFALSSRLRSFINECFFQYSTESSPYFWAYFPALLYGIAFFLGCYAHFVSLSYLFIPSLLILIPLLVQLIKTRTGLPILILGLTVFLVGWFYSSSSYPRLDFFKNGMTCYANVQIHNLSLKQTQFGKKWIYECSVNQLISEDFSENVHTYFKCLICLPYHGRFGAKRPKANKDYWILGKLIEAENGTKILKPLSKRPWKRIENSSSLAEKRFHWKNSVIQWIKKHIQDISSAHFLSGLATGIFDDYLIKKEFARFGLQHILAISGFHFAIIASFLSLLLLGIFPRVKALILLLVCLGGYTFFLGTQPSILRAWIMFSLTLVGMLFQKQTTALNSLGISTLMILSYDPALCQNLAFQLSFATTLSILLFYPIALDWLEQILPKRDLKQMLEMGLWHQHGYCILVYLRQGLALTIAVNMLAFPLTLYYFQQFPLLGILYNLFFPFLVSISVCLLLLGAFLSIVPWISVPVHYLNSIYTSFLLKLTYRIPNEMDHYFFVETVSPVVVILYMSLIIFWGISKNFKNNISHSQMPLTFI